MPDSGPTTVKQLKVSGHMMALEPGLYCIFNAPGGPVSDAATGLPGVRVTAAPGRSAGLITMAGFQADGWLSSDSASLVRVGGEGAEVLVTVYQAGDSQVDAPQLQVVRLSTAATAAAAAAPAPAAAPAAAPTPRVVEPEPAAPEPAPLPTVPTEIVAHVYGRGDVAGRFGDWIGEPGSQRWIEGFGVAPVGGIPAADLEYQAVLGRGWLSPWSEGGQFCGSRGMSLPILGLRVRLRGASATTHRVTVSGSFVDGTRLGPVGGGEACEAPSLAALEAFQIDIEPLAAKEEVKPASKASAPVRAKAARAKEAAPEAVQAGKPAAKPKPAAAKTSAPVGRASPASRRR